MTPNTRLLVWKISRLFLPIIKVDCVQRILLLVNATSVALTGTHGMMVEIDLADEQREE